jgi:hypothetical protein
MANNLVTQARVALTAALICAACPATSHAADAPALNYRYGDGRLMVNRASHSDSTNWSGRVTPQPEVVGLYVSPRAFANFLTGNVPPLASLPAASAPTTKTIRATDGLFDVTTEIERRFDAHQPHEPDATPFEVSLLEFSQRVIRGRARTSERIDTVDERSFNWPGETPAESRRGRTLEDELEPFAEAPTLVEEVIAQGFPSGKFQYASPLLIPAPKPIDRTPSGWSGFTIAHREIRNTAMRFEDEAPLSVGAPFLR